MVPTLQLHGARSRSGSDATSVLRVLLTFNSGTCLLRRNPGQNHPPHRSAPDWGLERGFRAHPGSPYRPRLRSLERAGRWQARGSPRAPRANEGGTPERLRSVLPRRGKYILGKVLRHSCHSAPHSRRLSAANARATGICRTSQGGTRPGLPPSPKPSPTSGPVGLPSLASAFAHCRDSKMTHPAAEREGDL